MGHLTPARFATQGREVLDWIRAYWERLEGLPILSRVRPGDIRARLPEHPPETGDPFDAVLEGLDSIVLPGITR